MNEVERQRNETDFYKACVDAGKRIREFDDAVIVHHFDADGIPAGSIVFSAMYRNGFAPAMQCWKKTTPEYLQKLKETTHKQIIFCDLGAGYTSKLAEALPNREIIILDHHEPETPVDQRPADSNITIVNPHDFGIDGGNEACGGGTSYLCFRGFPELSQLALVSTVGDMQDRAGLIGVNKLILKDSVDAGITTVKKDLRIFGRSSRSLIGFLSYASDPFLPGLTGNDKNCARFLAENEITYKQNDKYVSYYELQEDDRKRLSSALIEHCLANGMVEKAVDKMIGDVYLFNNEQPGTPFFDSHEFSAVMNACGRNNEAQTGVGACLKNPDSRKKAMEIMQVHRQNLRSGMTLAKHKLSDAGEFYLLDLRGQVKDSIIGTVAGATLANLVQSTKPIIAISLDEDDQEMLKISARGTNELIEKGLDLNQMLRMACKDLGKSVGGGHKVAAGASVEKRSLNEFLLKCAEYLRHAKMQ